ncbi:MAG TPA: PQQ-binding-like beta-propeller repeat protein, partial [Chloroflexota bacterium]
VTVIPTWGASPGVDPGGNDIGSTLGGVEWGSATDGTTVYVAEANYAQKPAHLTVGPGAGKTICTGFWAAINPADGTIKWETPVQPEIDAVSGSCVYNRNNLSVPIGPVSVANGVVYVGDLNVGYSTIGNMHALDASSGKELWHFQGAGSSNAGPAIVNGVLYWGNGYYIGVNSTTFYAFSLNGQ